jgi:hypothetical protein
MTWIDVLLSLGTGLASGGIIELLKGTGKPKSDSIDPDAVVMLIKDERFCKIIAGLYAALTCFLEQLSVIYCEVFPIKGYSGPEGSVADASEGRGIFVPDITTLFWRNFYEGVPDETELKDPISRGWVAGYRAFRETVTRAAVLETSNTVHQGFDAILAHSREAAAYLNSVFESIYDGTANQRPWDPRHKAFPIIEDEAGNELRFYTFGQESRFMATDQALDILMTAKAGTIRKRIAAEDRAAAHLLLLSIFGVTGMLYEVVLHVLECGNCKRRVRCTEW